MPNKSKIKPSPYEPDEPFPTTVNEREPRPEIEDPNDYDQRQRTTDPDDLEAPLWF